MKYDAAGAQLPRAPDRTLGNAILFALPFSPKNIGALRVHEFRYIHNRKMKFRQGGVLGAMVVSTVGAMANPGLISAAKFRKS